MPRRQHFISTQPALELCANCGALLLVGHADGLPYRVEMDPINWAGEVAAVLDHVPTFQLMYGWLQQRTGYEMRLRSADQIAVLVQHKCRRPVPRGQRQLNPPDPKYDALIKMKVQHGATDVPPPF